MKIKIRLFK